MAATPQPAEELKSQITRIARRHFALYGFNGASLKAIAKEAKVAGSLINYHFQDKDGLFKASVEPFARGRMEAIGRILNEPQNKDDLKVRIELFVEEMQAAYIADPDGFEVIDREIRLGNAYVMKLFEETLLSAFKHVVGFMKMAQEKGLIDENADPLILSSVLFTSTCDAARKNHIGKRYFATTFEDPAFRRRYAQQVAELFFKGVVK